MANEITRMDASRIAELIAKRELSPVAVMQAHLDRIAEVNPKVNAIVTIADGALDAAKKAEAAVKSNTRLGPLHGVPFTVKDSIDTAGVLSQRGSPIFKGRVAETDATVVARLKAAGAILIAKTNPPEAIYCDSEFTLSTDVPVDVGNWVVVSVMIGSVDDAVGLVFLNDMLAAITWSHGRPRSGSP